jgi:hypothetical protein
MKPELRIARMAAVTILAIVAGCAAAPKPPGTGGTIADGRQTVRVQAGAWGGDPSFGIKGTQSQFIRLPGTKCSMSNDRGTWEFVTPADVSVELSPSALRLGCTREGYRDTAIELRCVSPRSEAMKAGALNSMILLNPGPAAAPLFVGGGVAGVVLYFAATAAVGAAVGSATAGPDADACRYSLTGALNVVMTASTTAAAAARPLEPKATQEPEEQGLAPSSPASLVDILSSGRGVITYSQTGQGGKVAVSRAALRPSKDVLIVLPRGYALNMNREITAQAGVRYSPPIPIVGSSMAPGTKWSYSGTLEETGGVAHAAVMSSFEVIGREELPTPAGSFPAIHVREIRWQGRSGYRVDRWIDEWALIPLREEWTPHGWRWAGGQGAGSFSQTDPPAMEGTIEIRFLGGAS